MNKGNYKKCKDDMVLMKRVSIKGGSQTMDKQKNASSAYTISSFPIS